MKGLGCCGCYPLILGGWVVRLAWVGITLLGSLAVAAATPVGDAFTVLSGNLITGIEELVGPILGVAALTILIVLGIGLLFWLGRQFRGG